jgi:hypothetical protein
MTRRDPHLSREMAKNAIEFVVLWPVRIRHRRRARARQRVRDLALGAVRRTLARAAQLNANGMRTVFNVALYVLLLDDDLAHFTSDMVLAIGDRRRAFVAKHEAILLYEASEDLPQLLGKKFRAAVVGLGASADQQQRIGAISSDLSRFARQHREFLQQIRNALSAHRDHDTLGYVAALEVLQPREVMARAAELSRLLDRMGHVLAELVALTANTSTIFLDIVASAMPSDADRRD